MAFEGKGHKETAPQGSEVCEVGVLQWIHIIHSFFISSGHLAPLQLGEEHSEKETLTTFSYVNPHWIGLRISYLSKWGTDVLIPLFGHAREGAGDYHRMGLQDSSNGRGTIGS